MSPARTMRRLDDGVRRVVILTNPAAGSRSGSKLVADLAEQLRAGDLDVETVSDLDSLREATTGNGEVRAVVAAGGDGTVSAVVNRTTPDTPIAILPLGTENLFAKYLGLWADPSVISRQIRQGWTARIDAGLAGDRLFMLMVGVGFDADVVRRLDATRKGHINHFSYIKPILDSLRSYQYPAFQLYCSSKRVDSSGHETAWASAGHSSLQAVTARWAFIVNLPRYAAGLCFVPDAVGTDGRLDVCTFKRGSLINGLRYLTHLTLKKHCSLADVNVWQTTKLRIEADAPVPYQLDGDPGGVLPVEIQVLSERVNMIVDQAWALGHGFQHVQNRTEE